MWRAGIVDLRYGLPAANGRGVEGRGMGEAQSLPFLLHLSDTGD